MELLINDKAITLPTGPNEVTLGQRIAFEQEHGALLDEMLRSILSLPEDEQDYEFLDWKIERMFRVFSFFTGIPLEAVRESDFTGEVEVVYLALLQNVFDEPEGRLPKTFEWNGDTWQLEDPLIKQGSNITFGEFIDAKQALQDLVANGGSRFDQLHPLSAIFLKKKVRSSAKRFCSKVPIGLN